MASARYTRYITPEPPEEKHEMTPKEKRANFWYYNKWYFIGGAIALVLIAFFVHDIVSQVEPDYQITVLSPTMLPDSMLLSMEEQLGALADDRNADGQVSVLVQQYTLAVDESSNIDAYTQMAAVTKLASDVQNGDSMLFLTSDVAGYEQAQGFFAYNDGTAPEEGDAVDYSKMGVAWADCPALTALVFSDDAEAQAAAQQTMAEFSLVKRIFEGSALEGDEKLQGYYAASMDLFQRLTA